MISAFLRLGQDANEIVDRQRIQLDANRKAALQLGNQVRRLGDVKCAGGDEQNVIGAHHAVPRVHRRAFDDRQDVALHAFAADVGPVAGFAAGDLVDFIEKDDAAVLDALDGDARHLIHIDELLFFFLDQVIDRFGDLHLALLGPLAEESRKDIFDVDIHFLDALVADDLEGREVALLHFDFDRAIVELAIAKLRAQFLARRDSS